MYKIDYALVAAFVALLYAAAKQFLPDFPIAQDVLMVAFSYLLAKLGVEIVNKPAEAIRKFLSPKRGAKK